MAGKSVGWAKLDAACCLDGVLLLGLFVYIWGGIEPGLLYAGFGVFGPYPIFSWEASFLRTTFSTSAGPLSALAAVLSQSYRLDWLGAVVVTVVLGLLLLGIRHLPQPRVRLWRIGWVPVLLALMIYNHDYANPLPALLAVTVSVWTAGLYGAPGVRRVPGRAGLFVVLFAVVYYLTGAAAFIFAAIVCLTEALRHRRIVLAGVQAALAAGGVLALGRLAFGLDPRTIYTVGTPWDPSHPMRLSPLSNGLALGLYAFVPSLIVVAWLFRALAKPKAGLDAAPARPGGNAGALTVLPVLAVAVLAAGAMLLTRTHVRYERLLHYHAQRRDWEQVLAVAHRMLGRHPFTRSGVFDINRALAHLGRLGSELCAFPQNGTKTLFMSFDDMWGRLRHTQALELYLDLGFLNSAERNAYELLDQEGPSPYVLDALVRVHLAKEQYESARIVFRALQEYVGSRPYVRRWRQAVADPAQAQADPLIQSWRRAKPTTDQAGTGISLAMLQTSLRDTPEHRLAFEYLMAGYLLEHRRAELLNYLPLLRPLGYERLPRHYAEALLVHSLETRTPLDPQGWTIEPDVREEFREIRAVAAGAQGDHQAVFDTLAPKYGRTYMFYSMFNVCGVE